MWDGLGRRPEGPAYRAAAHEILYYPSEVKIMSFRNGDKSREHRLRKAREKKRETIRELKSKAKMQAGSSKK